MPDNTVGDSIAALTNGLYLLTYCVAMQDGIDTNKLLADWQALASLVDTMTPLQAKMAGIFAEAIGKAAAKQAEPKP